MDFSSIETMSHVVTKIFGETVSADFIKSLMIFTAAAFVHGRQVRKEIETQLGTLSAAILMDAKLQRERIDRIERHLKLIPEGGGTNG